MTAWQKIRLTVHHRLPWIPAAAGVCASLIGAVVLAGWHLHVPVLTNFGVGLPPMSYDAAAAMILAGAAMMLSSTRWFWPVRIIGLLVGLLGLMALIDYAFLLHLIYAPLGLDQHIEQTMPMPVISAIAMLLIGAGLIVGTLGRFHQRQVGLLLLGAVTCGVAVYSLLGGFGEVGVMYGQQRLTQVSLGMAISIALIGVGLVVLGWIAEAPRDIEQVSIDQLRRSILSYSVGAVILIVIISCVLAVTPIYRQLRASQNERLNEIAFVRSLAISEYMLRAETMVVGVTSRRPLRVLMRNYNHGVASKAKLNVLAPPMLADEMAYTTEMHGLTLVGLSGQTLVRMGRKIPESLWPPAPKPLDNANTDGPVKFDGGYYMVVRAAVRPPSGKGLLGWIISLVSMASINRILDNRSDLGHTGRVALAVPSSGKVTLWSVDALSKRFVSEPAPPYLVSLIHQVMANRGTARQQTTHDGVLYAARAIPDRDYAVVVAMQETELYAEVYLHLVLTLLGVLILAVLGALGMLLVVRPLTGGIIYRAGTLERKVTEATTALEHELAERKRYEVQLKEAADALERSNHELEQFAYIASHDLQEPLRKIISFGEMLKTSLGDKLEESSENFLVRMTGSAIRLQTLIADLLQYSRISSGPQVRKPVNLKQLMLEVIDDLQVRVEESNAKIEMGDLPTLIASPIQMRQLFQNLISNALKFQRPGVPPHVTITSRLINTAAPHDQHMADTTADVPDAVEPEEQRLCEITVADNGIGFDTKYADKIFVPFQRLHDRTTYPGTGIGLAVCQKIAERHGGAISVRSKVGEGSSFIVTLPLEQP